MKTFLTLFFSIFISGCGNIENIFYPPKQEKKELNHYYLESQGYYFGYSISGIKDIQVFDLGSKTFVQMQRNIKIYDISSIENGISEREVFQKNGYLITIPTVSNNWIINTNEGVFVINRNKPIEYKKFDQELMSYIVEAKIKSLIHQMSDVAKHIKEIEEKL